MPKPGITFRVENYPGFSLKEEAKIKAWIEKVLKQEGKTAGNIAYVFCADEFLLKINRQFLKHDFYTDIITFDYPEPNAGISRKKEKLHGEIFISVDRVKDNALSFKQPFQKELMRTVIHGILHLCGYNDKTPSDKKRMRAKEEEALATMHKK